MTIEQYCTATGTSPGRVRQWIQRGLPHTPAQQIDIDRNTVDAWKESKKIQRGNDAAAA